MAVAVKPAGRVSVIVTVPLVASAPVFLAVSVYAAPICPCVKFPVCDLVRVRMGAVELLMMVVGSETVPLELLPPPDTAAVFVTLAGALPATFTVSVMAG
jgi:hypothetical protein